MSTPLATETVVVASYRYLVAQPSLTDLLPRDGIAGDGWGPWLFSQNMHVDLEGTSGEAVVLTHEGSWTSSNRHNTLAFPRLRVQCWSDPSRDAGRNVTAHDAPDKGWVVWMAVRSLLHRPGAFAEQWSEHVRVIGSYCLDEPVWPMDPTPQGNDSPGYWEGYFALTAVYGR